MMFALWNNQEKIMKYYLSILILGLTLTCNLASAVSGTCQHSERDKTISPDTISCANVDKLSDGTIIITGFNKAGWELLKMHLVLKKDMDGDILSIFVKPSDANHQIEWLVVDVTNKKIIRSDFGVKSGPQDKIGRDSLELLKLSSEGKSVAKLMEHIQSCPAHIEDYGGARVAMALGFFLYDMPLYTIDSLVCFLTN